MSSSDSNRIYLCYLSVLHSRSFAPIFFFQDRGSPRLGETLHYFFVYKNQAPLLFIDALPPFPLLCSSLFFCHINSRMRRSYRLSRRPSVAASALSLSPSPPLSSPLFLKLSTPFPHESLQSSPLPLPPFTVLFSLGDVFGYSTGNGILFLLPCFSPVISLPFLLSVSRYHPYYSYPPSLPPPFCFVAARFFGLGERALIVFLPATFF